MRHFAHCLNRSTDFAAIWWVGLHLWAPVTHCVRVPEPPRGRGDLAVEPKNKHAIASDLRKKDDLRFTKRQQR